MELTIERLSKRYGQHWALRELSLRAEPGMLGLVGPNGAGKTTLMRMIATLLEPSEGSIRWNGQDIRAHGQALRQVLGYLPQDFGIYPEFTGRQFLRYLGAMKGLPRSLVNRRVDEVLSIVQMEQEADRKLPTYSGGMKQRIGIAQALLNDPELLIVDEPTAGLDPAERVRFRTLLAIHGDHNAQDACPTQVNETKVYLWIALRNLSQAIIQQGMSRNALDPVLPFPWFAGVGGISKEREDLG